MALRYPKQVLSKMALAQFKRQPLSRTVAPAGRKYRIVRDLFLRRQSTESVDVLAGIHLSPPFPPFSLCVMNVFPQVSVYGWEGEKGPSSSSSAPNLATSVLCPLALALFSIVGGRLASLAPSQQDILKRPLSGSVNPGSKNYAREEKPPISHIAGMGQRKKIPIWEGICQCHF